MVDIAPKFINNDGAGLVPLTRAEFNKLMAIANQVEEDAADVEMYDIRKTELAAEANSHLPMEVSARLLKGDRRIKALRKWRGITQLHLAMRTNLAQGYLSDLEIGRRIRASETLKLIAENPDVDPSWLVNDAKAK